MSLREWAASAVVASFPMGDERRDIWQAVLRYMAWLDELPVRPDE